jgi:hypothetical protein
MEYRRAFLKREEERSVRRGHLGLFQRHCWLEQCVSVCGVVGVSRAFSSWEGFGADKVRMEDITRAAVIAAG